MFAVCPTEGFESNPKATAVVVLFGFAVINTPLTYPCKEYTCVSNKESVPPVFVNLLESVASCAVPDVIIGVQVDPPLAPTKPEVPDEPLVPELPLEPEVPVDPELPLDPDDPDVPDDPAVPSAPLVL